MPTIIQVWRVWRSVPKKARSAVYQLLWSIVRGQRREAFKNLEVALVEAGYTETAERAADEILKRIK